MTIKEHNAMCDSCIHKVSKADIDALKAINLIYQKGLSFLSFSISSKKSIAFHVVCTGICILDKKFKGLLKNARNLKEEF